jgi:hypothetical protein
MTARLIEIRPAYTTNGKRCGFDVFVDGYFCERTHTKQAALYVAKSLR